MATGETKIKGISFLHMGLFVEQEFKAAGVQRLHAALAPEVLETLQSSYGHEWYPLAHLVEVEKAVATLFFAGDASQMERFGHFDGLRQIGGIYRIMLKLATPPFLLKQSARIWRTYMDRGELVIQDEGPNTATVAVSGYDPLHVVHCYENIGTFRAGLEVCGAKAPVVRHRACRLQGAPACLFEARW